MAKRMPAKDVSAILDYEWDWSDWLHLNETIINAAITTPTGLTLENTLTQTTKVIGWFSGGEDGKTYMPACEIVTNQGRTDERTMIIPVVADR